MVLTILSMMVLTVLSNEHDGAHLDDNHVSNISRHHHHFAHYAVYKVSHNVYQQTQYDGQSIKLITTLIIMLVNIHVINLLMPHYATHQSSCGSVFILKLVMQLSAYNASHHMYAVRLPSHILPVMRQLIMIFKRHLLLEGENPVVFFKIGTFC